MAAAAFAECEAQPWEAQEKCYGMLLKVLQNVVQNPGEAKFRSIKESSAALQQKVLACPGGEAALLAAGFSKVDGAYVLSGADAEAACAAALAALEAHANKAKQNMLRKQRDEEIAKCKAECANTNCMKGEAPERLMTDEMKAQIERDRAELEAARKHSGVKDSKAQLTKFGMNGMATAQDTNSKGG
jgi:hypothetical protein